MTKKSLKTPDGVEFDVNIDQVVYSRKNSDGNYICSLSNGSTIVFTENPLA